MNKPNINDLNHQMLRIRMVEERIAKKYPEGKMRCPVHLSIGQESAAVGVCAAIQTTDKMVSTHRGHAHYLAKGGSLNGLIGELYGKSSGCSRGNGGSMHLLDLSCNFWGSTSIVGGTIPYGVGIAFADNIKDLETITVVCIGDAAVEQGVFHEAANFASLHKLRVVFVCENNKYSCYTHIRDRQPDRSLEEVACAHDIAYVLARPNDVEHIYEQMSWVVKDRIKRGPVFLEIPTYRHLEHCGPNNDDHLGYRNQAELNMWRNADPVFRAGIIDSFQIKREIDLAFEHADLAADAEPMSCYAD